MQRQFLYLSSAEAQLSLGFGEEAPTERLFFAVMADAPAAGLAAALSRDLLASGQVQGNPLASERLHVTLHHLGDYAGGLPPSLLARAMQAAGTITHPAFEVQFDRVGTFSGRSAQLPCVLRGEDGVRGVSALQAALGRSLAHQGVAGDAQFTPHMTLLYSRAPLPQRRIPPLGWRVGEFVLIRSFLGQTRYQIEGRWSLH